MRLLRVAPLAAIAVLAAACSSGGGAPNWTFAPAAPAQAAAASAPPATPSGAMADAASAPTTAGGTGTGDTAAASASPSAAGLPAVSPTRIAVTLTDELTVELASSTVRHGVPVTFVITNTGSVLHELTLGNAAEQDAHDAEMLAAGGMSMPRDEPNAVSVEPGQTKELTFYFETPGTTLAGCHVVGHYQAGMKAEITVD